MAQGDAQASSSLASSQTSSSRRRQVKDGEAKDFARFLMDVKNFSAAPSSTSRPVFRDAQLDVLERLPSVSKVAEMQGEGSFSGIIRYATARIPL